MLNTRDQEYIDTKKIKSGHLALDEKFAPFASWINLMYKVEILNIVTDYINDDTLRLQLIFEHQKDVEIFRPVSSFTNSVRKEKAIKRNIMSFFRIKLRIRF